MFPTSFYIPAPTGSIAVLILVLTTSALAAVPAFDPGDLPPGHELAVFAGGCFWCMEPPFDEMPGVTATISGYTGGHLDNPTYRMVTRTDTGHYESVLVIYNPLRVSYRELLEVFWVNINPLDAGGQFCDRGPSYRSAIFTANAAQRELAEASRAALAASDWAAGRERPIATVIRDLQAFWIAEDYHQDYYLEHSFNYTFYRSRCGRDERLERLWGASDQRRSLIRMVLHPEG